MKLFLDLENTLISNWGENIFLNHKIDIIKQFIKDNNIKEATIFSFALTNQKDNEYFKKNLKVDLEEALNISLNVCIIEDIFKIITTKYGISAEFYEFNDVYLFNGKSDMFTHFVKLLQDENEEYVLFDDVVEDSTINLKKQNKVIEFKNI